MQRCVGTLHGPGCVLSTPTAHGPSDQEPVVDGVATAQLSPFYTETRRPRECKEGVVGGRWPQASQPALLTLPACTASSTSLPGSLRTSFERIRSPVQMGKLRPTDVLVHYLHTDPCATQ